MELMIKQVEYTAVYLVFTHSAFTTLTDSHTKKPSVLKLSEILAHILMYS